MSAHVCIFLTVRILALDSGDALREGCRLGGQPTMLSKAFRELCHISPCLLSAKDFLWDQASSPNGESPTGWAS
jgi:hypothetical protein